MEEGSLRCDANVSLRPAGTEELGTKTELKNMNSFRFLERGIEAEIERQAAILDGGGPVEQETLHFDPRIGIADAAALEGVLARLPLLPRARPGAAGADRGDDRRGARRRCPSCPAERRERYASELGLSEKPATQLAFDAELGAYFERVARRRRAASSAPTIANWVTGELVARAARGRRRRRRPRGLEGQPRGAGEAGRDGRGEGGLDRRRRARCWRRWSPRAAIRPRSPSARGSAGSRTAGELEAIVERALEADPEAAERVRDGNAKAIGPLVGFVMRETKGRADGGEVTRLIREKLRTQARADRA